MAVHQITAGNMPWHHSTWLTDTMDEALSDAANLDGALPVMLLLEAADRAGVLAQVVETLGGVAAEYLACDGR
jgi:hypothetical protein